jgi:hypothetical protein
MGQSTSSLLLMTWWDKRDGTGKYRGGGMVWVLGPCENRNEWVGSGWGRNTGAWDEIQILSGASGRSNLLLRKGGWGKVAKWVVGMKVRGPEGSWTVEMACFPLLWFLSAKELCEKFLANDSTPSKCSAPARVLLCGSLCSQAFPPSQIRSDLPRPIFGISNSTVEILGFRRLSGFSAQRPEVKELELRWALVFRFTYWSIAVGHYLFQVCWQL